MIEIEEIIIETEEDLDAGIRSTHWTLGPDFYFEEEEDMKDFCTQIKKVFENHFFETMKVYAIRRLANG
jgi:hypothetical protein